MKFYGEANLQSNYLREAVIPLDTYFPANPKVGQLVFKDKILYICIEIQGGLPIWCPLTNEITSYTHFQNTNATTWTIAHPLNTNSVSVTVYDTSNRVVMPDDVMVNSNNTVTVSFTSPCQGKAVVLAGYIEGQPKPTYAFDFIQTTPSTSWTISHGLGRYPSIRVFIGNQEVQPQTITFDTVDQVTITFSTPQVGQAKLI